MNGTSLSKSRHGLRKSAPQFFKREEQVTYDQSISKDHHLKQVSNRPSMSNTELSTNADNDSSNFLLEHDPADVTILPRGGVIFKQFAYHKNSEGPKGIYYKCSLYRSKHCMARLIQRDGQLKKKGQEHNHDPPEIAANLTNSGLDAQSCYVSEKFTNSQNHGHTSITNGSNMDPAFADFLDQNEESFHRSEEVNEKMDYKVEPTEDEGDSGDVSAAGLEHHSLSLVEASQNIALPNMLAKSRVDSRIYALTSKMSKQSPRSQLNNQIQKPRSKQIHHQQSLLGRQSIPLESGWNYVKCPKEDEQEHNLEEVISVNENTQQNDRLRIVIERSDPLRQLVGLEFERTGNTVKIKIAPKTSFMWQKTDE